MSDKFCVAIEINPVNFSEKKLSEFWKRVNKNGPVKRPELGPCWLWTGATMCKGYGVLSTGTLETGYKNLLAHRVSFAISNGSLSPKVFVCHSCDTPLCVNPSHLFEGTYWANMEDMKAKKRHTHGVRQWKHKLTEVEVLQIRELYASGQYVQKQLADQFNVTRPTISLVVNHKIWTHI